MGAGIFSSHGSLHRALGSKQTGCGVFVLHRLSALSDCLGRSSCRWKLRSQGAGVPLLLDIKSVCSCWEPDPALQEATTVWGSEPLSLR